MNTLARFSRQTVMIAWLLAFLLGSHVAAASGSEPLQLKEESGTPARVPSSLDSLVAVALDENPRVEAARASHGAALARVPRAGALPDPMLMAAADGAPVKNPSPAEAEMGRFTLTQMLPFPGKLGLMRKGMAHEAEAAGSRAARVRLEVAYEVHSAYYDLHLIHESIGVLERSVASLETLLPVVRDRYRTGLATQADLLRVRVELADQQTNLSTLRLSIQAAEARLNAALGRPPGSALARPSLPDTVLPSIAIPEIDQAVLDRQPMLKVERSMEEKARADLALARREGLPDFTLGIEYMNRRDMDDAWTGMFGLTLPIWRWNKVGPQRREAEARLMAAAAERRRVLNESISLAREAYAMAITSRDRVRVYEKEILPDAEMALASSLASYPTGEMR
ncbi:MAG: TolC family protein, partial [Candidatus Eisenbacteria bacterium]|nr:TolC family protein [Candidatus Eisenbacteria bacterium]